MALHREWEFGTIAPGRRADLILLRGSPIETLANLRALEAVVLRGRVRRPEDLEP